MTTYRFWNAPATIVYIRGDNVGNDLVDGGDSWVPVGICRGSVDISGSSEYESITTDYNQGNSLPADQLLTGTSYNVSLDLAKPYNKYADGTYQLNDELLTYGSTPASPDTSFGRQKWSNLPIVQSGSHYNLLLWSQVARANISVSAPVTNYVLFWGAIPQSFEMTWGTRGSVIKCSWKCVEAEPTGVHTLNTTTTRRVADYGYSEIQPAGAPPSVITF